MRTHTPSLQAYRKQYETAKSLGAALLACNAVLVIQGYENLHILLQNFQRPITSMNDPADVDYARGLQGHATGTRKTNFESQWTFIETETGMISKFAEDLVTKFDGEIPLARVYDGFVGDGDEGFVVEDGEDTAVKGVGDDEISSGEFRQPFFYGRENGGIVIILGGHDSYLALF